MQHEGGYAISKTRAVAWVCESDVEIRALILPEHTDKWPQAEELATDGFTWQPVHMSGGAIIYVLAKETSFKIHGVMVYMVPVN